MNYKPESLLTRELIQTNLSIRQLLTAAVLFLSSLAPMRAAAGKVYLVIGSDTAVWNVAGGVDVTQFHGHFLSDLYILPQNNAYKVMDPAFRNRFLDSYNQPLKLTWWMLVGSVYRQAPNTDVPIPNLMPLYLMKKYHGDAIRQFGDELTLHYHTFFWSDYDGDGKFYWNQAKAFRECRADFDFSLAQSLVEEEVFPVSFRSGWHYMDNEWQSYLNLLLPFSMHNDSPNVHTDTVEPLDNVYDWSIAPLTFVPYHPSTTNYQIPGDGIGWNLRSVKMPNVTQTMMNQIFAQAASGTDQVASLWAHLPESTFLTNIATMDAFAQAAAAKYPTVQFRYCTAVEAMQRWLGNTDQTPPVLDVAAEIQDETVTLNLSVSEPIFQPQPFVAMKDICEQYQILPCATNPAAANSWTVTLPAPRSALAKVAIAVTDLAGNLTTRIIRYLPDDIYLDNLAPEYTEVSGNWISTTNAAWGVDARTALLSANDLARVRWSLPISNTGPYKVFIQIPAITNAAGNLQFDVVSGGSNVLSVFFPDSLPSRQWFYIGTAILDQTVENSLEMRVDGSSQPNTLAVADVIKLSPLLPQPGFINDVRVDPGATTANITWTTLFPATSSIEYGLDAGYGRIAASNSLPLINHVVTLTSLTPNTTYYFQIHSSVGSTPYVAQYCFTTTNFTTNFLSTLVFDLTNVWKYSTNNLDGVNWRAVDYNDSSWQSGPGLLWVDTRAGGSNSAVQPKGTQMPSGTVRPFSTYYFRTHFPFTNSTAGFMLTFSNYIDDGAVFYLNGAEIYRNNMAPAPAGISNSTLAVAYNCAGDATCPVIFNVAGGLLTNLLVGDNLLAVEVHNYASTSPDITFGSALSYSVPSIPRPKLNVIRSGEVVMLYWNGSGFTLQEGAGLSQSKPTWTDLPGPITTSPYAITNASTAA